MKNIILLLVSSIILISLFTWSFKNRRASSEISYSRKIIGECYMAKSQNISFSPSNIILANNSLFVISNSDNEVFKYNLDLQFIKKIKFPSSLRDLINFSVEGDTAYAVDGTQTLVALNINTLSYRTKNLKKMHFSRCTSLYNGSFLLKGSDKESNGRTYKEVFKVASVHNGNTLFTNDVIKDLGDYGLNSDGFFIKDKYKNVYSVSYLNSNIYAFDKSGNYLATLHTIGNTNREYSVKLLGSSRTFGEPTVTLNIKAGADSLLYLYSRVKSSRKKTSPNDSYIDAYSLKNNYIGSLIIHKVSSRSFQGLVVTGNNIIVTEGGQLVLYKKTI